jgi:hypothetical protein
MPEFCDCGKCGWRLISQVGASGLLEPWCLSCRRANRDEYKPIYKTWVLENAAQRRCETLGWHGNDGGHRVPGAALKSPRWSIAMLSGG